jgi:peptide/nickel transport system substrate-binding protein
MLGGLQWPKWGLFIESHGKQGEPCDMDEGKKLLELLHTWESSTDDAACRKAWDEILAMNAEQVFSIGTVNAVRQPLTVGKKLRNVPEKGYWAWDPGGYIGLYKPDTFWVSQ